MAYAQPLSTGFESLRELSAAAKHPPKTARQRERSVGRNGGARGRGATFVVEWMEGDGCYLRGAASLRAGEKWPRHDVSMVCEE